MKRRWSCAVWIAAAPLLSTGVRADPPLGAQAEISFLLAEVAKSDCEFYRNGSWYSAARAAAHLQDKYASRSVMARVASAEDFIELVGTRSSFSGLAYAISCPGVATVPSAQWFKERLAALRHALD